VVRPSSLPPLIDPLGGSIDKVPVPIVAERSERPTVPSAMASAFAGGRQPKIASVLRSKIQPPPLRTSTLSRQRLLDRLASATQNRVTLVVADAGYGKTTLLADFSRRFDGTCMWYSLDSTDADWQTVITHLLAAAKEVRPEFGESTTALLRSEPGMPPPKAAATGSLLQELQAFAGERTVLVLDDIHTVEESREAKELLLRVLRDAPAGFSFVLTSRHRPSISLARWAGMGELVELTTDDLRFSQLETARLFDDSYGQPLEPDVLRELDAKTRGWAACLQLFSTLINGQSASAVRAMTQSLSGSSGPLYEYLAQEVVAHVSPELQSFLTRASLLQPVTLDLLGALFPNERVAELEALVAEADALGLLGRISQSGAARQFHPLLRDFLQGELARRLGTDRVIELHADIARAAEADPLTAAHHYIEAGIPAEAMRCLAVSSLQTMGSGRWGTASQLAARLEGQPANGAVAAIQGRRLLEEGDLPAAAQVLRSMDITGEDPTVRAVIRHTLLSLGWRTGDSEAIVATLKEILADDETPTMMRDIAQVFLDSSPQSEAPASLAELSARLQRMAKAQEAAGYDYYAAISLHNAAVAALHSGRLEAALRIGLSALDRFHHLPAQLPEKSSSHAMLATVLLELGRTVESDQHVAAALAAGTEHADVDAEIAYLLAATGDRSRAAHLVRTAIDRDRDGHSDLVAKWMMAVVQAYVRLPLEPLAALDLVEPAPGGFPLNLGYDAEATVLRSLCRLLAGDHDGALEIARNGLSNVRSRGNLLFEGRLRLLEAMALQDPVKLRDAVRDSAIDSQLVLVELADALGDCLHLLTPYPPPIEESFRAWPARWRPVLRRQLARGDDPRAHLAATLLDVHGAVEDVGRLRAYEKTYKRKRGSIGLGRDLSRRVSPRLHVQDLGQVLLTVGDRMVNLSRTRRKPAALLMYLVTRPNYTATRDQIVEDLWPEGETSAGLNSLNQSLYFIRREVDPWYEDDLSTEYFLYQSELVSLDPDLVKVDSADFVTRSRDLLSGSFTTDEAVELIGRYRGQFSPEFEYEEWALAWRTRVHGAFLDFAGSAMVRLAERGELRVACDIALRVLRVDPNAGDIERRLIWLYWRAGARSAAQAHHAHLAARDEEDGLQPESLESIVGSPVLK
jgi:LuxR family transcriptional regulator, maltose regulon positive regulatory protein